MHKTVISYLFKDFLADTNDTNTFAPSGYLDKISAGKIEEISLNAAWFNILTSSFLILTILL